MFIFQISSYLLRAVVVPCFKLDQIGMSSFSDGFLASTRKSGFDLRFHVEMKQSKLLQFYVDYNEENSKRKKVERFKEATTN
jgi:hypothetical protein